MVKHSFGWTWNVVKNNPDGLVSSFEYEKKTTSESCVLPRKSQAVFGP